MLDLIIKISEATRPVLYMILCSKTFMYHFS